jgi:hypothetical protein
MQEWDDTPSEWAGLALLKGGQIGVSSHSCMISGVDWMIGGVDQRGGVAGCNGS